MVTMSKSAPQPASQPLELLDHEQSQVSAALQATLRDLWGHVPNATQLKTWAEANPLMAASLAAGVGAVTGAMVTPSTHHAAPASSTTAPLPESRPSLFGSLLGQALPMVGMAISEAGRTLLMTSLAGQNQEQAPAASQAEEFDPGEGI